MFNALWCRAGYVPARGAWLCVRLWRLRPLPGGPRPNPHPPSPAYCALRRPSASSCSEKMAEVMVPPLSVGSFLAIDACAGPRARAGVDRQKAAD